MKMELFRKLRVLGIMGLLVCAILVINSRQKEMQEKQQEYTCLSFANYCLEVHEITPTHETYKRFMIQEKLFPGYYKKHIIDAQIKFDTLNEKIK